MVYLMLRFIGHNLIQRATKVQQYKFKYTSNALADVPPLVPLYQSKYNKVKDIHGRDVCVSNSVFKHTNNA